MSSQELLQIDLERRYRTRSLMFSSVLMLLLYLAFYLIPAIQLSLPLPERDPYRTVGIIDFSQGEPGGSGAGPTDFGNETEGSGDVNNFLDPVKDPDPLAQVPDKVTRSAPSSAPPAGNKSTLTQTEASPIKTKASTPSPQPKDNRAATHGNPQPNGSPTATGSTGNAGSNHGNGTGTGNAGTPQARTLDPRGLYGGGGGDGFDGLGGRGVLRADKPNIRFEAEGRVKYKVIIAPDGRVLSFEPVSGLTPGLRQPSRDAAAHVLRNWRFEPVEASAGNQACYYTISYTLH
jgi:outer membrane biosynthesis protein TonB